MDLNTLIQYLQLPDAYPWGPAEVEVIQTHISWVFLAGDRVLKLKRPLDLEFVDLTSFKQREWACREEVRLNRRLTDGVYLDVVPIRTIGNRVTVGGEGGSIVEWGTLMRRLPADRMLDVLIANNSVPADAGRHLADRLIPFHLTESPRCPAAFDTANRIVVENLDQLADACTGSLDPKHMHIVDHAMRTFMREREALFRHRAAEWIRDGHGDLRCEHICLEPNIVQVFDCVEFSRDIRCADAVSYTHLTLPTKA
jgi:aminoglycoside phosphotransferase family enzyme